MAGYAEAPHIVFEIIRGIPPYPAPEGQEWTYLGDRVWELSDPPVIYVDIPASVFDCNVCQLPNCDGECDPL